MRFYKGFVTLILLGITGCYDFGLAARYRNRRSFSRVVGGEDATDGAFPFFALITKKGYTPEESLDDENLRGAGSIINHQWILTAAHVLHGENLKERVVFVGLSERPSSPHTVDSFVKVYSIAKYIEHPLYDKRACFDFDIALIKLGPKFDERMQQENGGGDEGLIFGPRIRSISMSHCSTSSGNPIPCLWSFSNETAVVVGFGHTDAALVDGEVNQKNFNPPKRLQRVEVTFMEPVRCRTELERGRRELNESRFKFTRNMMCCSSDKADACVGDSGGPLMVKLRDQETQIFHWAQVGIVSFGIGCASDYPGYYTSVEMFRPWIKFVLSWQDFFFSEPAKGIRLVGGGNINSGRVEVLYNGIWGTICDDNWDINEGNVVCRMMGYSEATSAPRAAHFGQGVGKIWLDNVHCGGSEYAINWCPMLGRGTHNCRHTGDASVICKTNVRLVGGRNNSGLVELQRYGVWARVCDDDWDQEDANVICRMLGFRRGASHARLPAENYNPGYGYDGIWLDDVDCSGSETDIGQCPKHNNRSRGHNCNEYEDATAYCLEEGIIRLVGGTGRNSGRVELHHLGVWGTVCDDNWDLNDARVICRMLGFSEAIAAIKSANFGQGSGKIWLDNVNCLGREVDIGDCEHLGWGVHDCRHNEDASVICS